MILCDTNIIIDSMKGNSDVLNTLRQIGQDQIGVSAITIAELQYGAFNKQELRQIMHHLQPLQMFPITTAISD